VRAAAGLTAGSSNLTRPSLMPSIQARVGTPRKSTGHARWRLGHVEEKSYADRSFETVTEDPMSYAVAADASIPIAGLVSVKGEATRAEHRRLLLASRRDASAARHATQHRPSQGVWRMGSGAGQARQASRSAPAPASIA
jgi:hypothetical protein